MGISESHEDRRQNRWARLLNNSGSLHRAIQKAAPSYLLNYIPAEDLVSETLQYANKNQEQWQHIPDEELIFYLRKMAKMIMLNHSRKYRLRKSLHRGTTNDANQIEETDRRKNRNAVQKMHKVEKESALATILGRLRQTDYRKIVDLVWIQGHSISEASKILGRTHGATKVLLHRAMSACRAIARRDSFAGFRVSGETH